VSTLSPGLTLKLMTPWGWDIDVNRARRDEAEDGVVSISVRSSTMTTPTALLVENTRQSGR
jgi:hypothetical protein